MGGWISGLAPSLCEPHIRCDPPCDSDYDSVTCIQKKERHNKISLVISVNMM